jgi:hypothetical protein
VVLDFVFGMLVAWVYLERRTAPFAAVAVVLAASVTIFAGGVLGGIGGTDARVLYWGIADSGFLFSVLFIEREWGWWCPGLLAQLGEASFATYLSNLFTLALVAKAIQMTGLFPILGTVGSQTLLVLSALAVGVWMSLLVERPLHTLVLRNGARWFFGSPARAPAPL